MLSVGVTGNIGAGKSTVVELFRRWGATIIDADQLVRELQAPGQLVLTRITARFGTNLLNADGTLNRAALRARVLAEAGALEDLNAIVHPEVQRRRHELLAAARARGDRIVVSDIPLLFDSVGRSEFDVVVLVDAPESVRRDRLLATRALPPDEVDRMIALQEPSASKRTRSECVIDNDGDFAALERAAAAVWQWLVARA
jgi:dephospho-CoA kinase